MRKDITFAVVMTVVLCPWTSGPIIATQHKDKATVELVAYDTYGNRLGAPSQIMDFESIEDHKNLAEKFHDGLAEDIPFDVYRVEARLPAYYSARRYVNVYQDRVIVILGLQVGTEQQLVPRILRGHVAGITTADNDRSFAKITGVYSDVSFESKISQNGEFEMAGVSDGLYILLVAGGKGILASQLLRVPYQGTVEINAGGRKN